MVPQENIIHTHSVLDKDSKQHEQLEIGDDDSGVQDNSWKLAICVDKHN